MTSRDEDSSALCFVVRYMKMNIEYELVHGATSKHSELSKC